MIFSNPFSEAIYILPVLRNFSKIAIMAVLVWVDMAINMVNMGM